MRLNRNLVRGRKFRRQRKATALSLSRMRGLGFVMVATRFVARLLGRRD